MHQVRVVWKTFGCATGAMVAVTPMAAERAALEAKAAPQFAAPYQADHGSRHGA